MKPEIVVCIYCVRKGKVNRFVKLLAEHRATLRELRLATARPHRVYSGADKAKNPFVVEIFAWTNTQAVETAHRSPALLAVWERMEPLCEKRSERPAMEFPHVEDVTP